MMRTLDLVTSLFWLAFSLLVGIEALRLGIGTVGKPGAGLMAFGSSLVLGILSVSLFLRAVVKKRDPRIDSIPSGRSWKRVALVLTALLVYAKLVTTGGYLLCTFLLMSFLFWIVKEQKQKWWWILVLSLLSTTLSYYVFAKGLNCDLPYGIFDF